MAAAGEIQGIATLAADVSRLGKALNSRLGGQQIDFKPERYEAVVRKLHGAKGKQRLDLTGNEVADFVTGIALKSTDAIVRAKQLAEIQVSDESQRAQVHEAQAAIIDPARLMWQQASDVLSTMEPKEQGASGLGNPIIIAAVIIGGAIIYGAAIAAVVAAITYLLDTQQRLEWAKKRADDICKNAKPKCTPEQYARIQKQLMETALANTPWNEAAKQIGEGIGRGVTIAAAMAGSAAVVTVGFFLWDWWKNREA